MKTGLDALPEHNDFHWELFQGGEGETPPPAADDSWVGPKNRAENPDGRK